jgi:glycosyltransferase involved in cell wall biosynthesis
MKYRLPVSVVMPCYNSGKFVSCAIESILNQTFADFELIIIDDGSTDNTVLEITKHKDDRIRFYSLKENKGNYFARNMGLCFANGKYVCVMDADDLSSVKRLAIQCDYMNSHPNIGAIGSQGELIDEKGILLNKKFVRPLVSPAQLKIFLLMDNYILHPSLMIRSGLLKKHQLFYNEKYRYASDFDFVSRCAGLFPVRNIHNNLIMYRVHGTQISTKNRVWQTEYADQIRLSRLKAFKIRLTENEKKIYLSMMKRLTLSSVNELQKGMILFNKLLSNNFKLKIYNHKLLYEFFDYTLSLAKEKLRNQ